MTRPPPRTAALGGLALVLVGLAPVGCVDPPPDAGPPNVPYDAFRRDVYPLLLRDCGFPACHGSPDRFFRVFGPNRARLDPELELDGPASDIEVRAAYERARSMLASARTPSESLLLRKPLEVDVGGAPHMGVDAFGRDVYPNRDHPSYQTLLAWARGGEEPGADGEDGSGEPTDEGYEDGGYADGGVGGGVTDAGGGA